MHFALLPEKSQFIFCSHSFIFQPGFGNYAMFAIYGAAAIVVFFAHAVDICY